MDVSTYVTIKQSRSPITPIPEPYICIFLSPELPHMSCLGIKDQVRSFVLTDISDDPQGEIRNMPTDKDVSIITNNGKSLATYFMNAGILSGKIIDIIFNERIISTGRFKEILPEVPFMVEPEIRGAWGIESIK